MAVAGLAGCQAWHYRQGQCAYVHWTGVVRACSIRKKPYEEQWGRSLVKEMRGAPARPNPNVCKKTEHTGERERLNIDDDEKDNFDLDIEDFDFGFCDNSDAEP